jgi:hypothetical protein
MNTPRAGRTEVPANAHDLPSRGARPRGFEPLTFGSVDGRRHRGRPILRQLTRGSDSCGGAGSIDVGLEPARGTARPRSPGRLMHALGRGAHDSAESSSRGTRSLAPAITRDCGSALDRTTPGRDRLAPAWRQHVDAVFRRPRRRTLQSASPLDVTELGRRRGPGRNRVAEPGGDALKTGGRDGAQQSRRCVRRVAEGVGAVGRDVRRTPTSNRRPARPGLSRSRAGACPSRGPRRRRARPGTGRSRRR